VADSRVHAADGLWTAESLLSTRHHKSVDVLRGTQNGNTPGRNDGRGCLPLCHLMAQSAAHNKSTANRERFHGGRILPPNDIISQNTVPSDTWSISRHVT